MGSRTILLIGAVIFAFWLVLFYSFQSNPDHPEDMIENAPPPAPVKPAPTAAPLNPRPPVKAPPVASPHEKALQEYGNQQQRIIQSQQGTFITMPGAPGGAHTLGLKFEPPKIEPVAPLAAGLKFPERPVNPRAAWYYDTTVGAYRTAGKHDAKWDQLAIDTLWKVSQNWSSSGRECDWSEILASAESCQKAGCDDPLVQYCYFRARQLIKGPESGTIDGLLIAANSMRNFGYPPVRQIFANCMALENVNAGNGSPLKPMGDFAFSNLQAALADPAIPSDVAHEICHDVMTVDKQAIQDSKASFERVYAEVAKARPHSALAFGFKGAFYIDYAWEARGNGWASSVTEQGWTLMTQRLDIARQNLEYAWKLDPNDSFAATKMLSVNLGQSSTREEMELWFKRAITANPDNVSAYEAKMYYLQPRWFGEEQDMRDFGHECVAKVRASKNCPEEIALQIMRAHDMLSDDYQREKGSADGYWQRADVRKDIQDAFTLVLERRPKNSILRSKYAKYLTLAHEYGKAKEQFDLLGGDVNEHEFFMGSRAYKEVIDKATQGNSQF
jgi:hypothetical protein